MAKGNKAKRILVVSFYCPTRAHAGGLRIIDIYTLIKSKVPSVHIDLLTYARPNIDWSADELDSVFDNVYYSPCEDLSLSVLKESIGKKTLQYDVVDLQFHQAALRIDEFRTIANKVLFTPMESMAKVFYISLRNWRKSNGAVRFKDLAALFKLATQEIFFCRKADSVICVSESDARFIRSAGGGSRHVSAIETCLSPIEFKEALALDFIPQSSVNRSKSIVYVAYFGSATNLDALRWYLELVHPLIIKNVPDYKLIVVGRGDLTEFSSYKGESVELVGEVPLLAPYIRSSRLGIAPALSGSGFRGKVNQYAIYGIPSVVSTIAYQGLAYRDGESIMIANKPEKFAECCTRLLLNEELNDMIGLNARNLCLEQYTWSSKWPSLSKAYNLQEGLSR